MKRNLSLVLVIGTTTMILSSCQKDEQTAPKTTAPQSAQAQATNQVNATRAKGYDAGSIYQIELSANISGTQGGGVWLWIGLHSDWQGDYSGSDCGHGGDNRAVPVRDRHSPANQVSASARRRRR